MDNPPHSEDCSDAPSHGPDAHTQASPCAEINKTPEHEDEQMFSGAAESSPEDGPVDKLKLEVRIVLTRITPSAFGHGPASPDGSETEDDCAQNDRTSGIKAGGADRGVQLKILHTEVHTATTAKSAPQYIVDEEAILQLMRTCPLCKKQCRCNKHTSGPYVLFYQNCYFCDYRRKWANQPEAINMKSRKKGARRPRQKKHQSQCSTTVTDPRKPESETSQV